jgi:hypothetical protein
MRTLPARLCSLSHWAAGAQPRALTTCEIYEGCQHVGYLFGPRKVDMCKEIAVDYVVVEIYRVEVVLFIIRS